MSELFNYSSILATHMNRLIEMKTSAGIGAQRMKWILKEFDDFANVSKLADPISPKGLSVNGAQHALPTATEPCMPSTPLGHN